jgi:hypothetical protein
MRLATLRLTPDLFIEFAKACKDGPPRRFVVKENPLPADATIVRVDVDHVFNPSPFTLRLVLQSETFDEIAEGEILPELDPVVFETQFLELPSCNEGFEKCDAGFTNAGISPNPFDPEARKAACPECHGPTFPCPVCESDIPFEELIDVFHVGTCPKCGCDESAACPERTS